MNHSRPSEKCLPDVIEAGGGQEYLVSTFLMHRIMAM